LTGREGLAAIEQYVQLRSARTRDRKSEDEWVCRVAESLQRGIEPDALTQRVLRGMTVAAEPSRLAWNREVDAYLSLFLALMKRAGDSDDAAEAQKFARAAIIVLAQSRFVLIDNLESYFQEGRPDTPLAQAARLSRAQRRAIQATIEKLRAPREALLPHLRVVGNELANLIKDPNKPEHWLDGGERLCKGVVAGVEAGSGRIDYQWAVLANAWQAVCLARHQGQTGFISRMREATERLKQSQTDPIVLAWIAQVTELPGEAPKHPAWQVVDDPNQMKRGKPD